MSEPKGRSPFTLAPNPRVYYQNSRLEEQFDEIRQRLMLESGIFLITGDVGVGKTLLYRKLVASLREHFSILAIDDSVITPTRLKKRLVNFLRNIEVPERRAGPTTRTRVLFVVDEAQNLDFDAYEFLRDLINKDRAGGIVFSVLLVGQTEILARLNMVDLRQFQQRILVHLHLRPLSADQVSDYISYRLKAVGLPEKTFDRSARRAVASLSQGIPRSVNILCARGLYAASRARKSVVTKRMLTNIAEQHLVLQREVSRFSKAPFAVGAVLVSLLGVGGWLYINSALDLLERGGAGKVAESSSSEKPAREIETFLAGTGNGADVSPSQNSELLGDSQELALAEEPAAINLEKESTELEIPEAVSLSLEQRLLFSWVGGEVPQGEQLCESAQQYGLACLKVEDEEFQVLVELNRPAIIRTQANDFDERLLITSIDQQGIVKVVNVDGESYEVPRATLETIFTGDFELLWVPPTGYLWPLRVGSSNYELTYWLQDALNRLGYVDGRIITGGIYTQEFADIVKGMQRKMGLAPDGILGPLSIVGINNALGGDAPKLR